MLHAYRQKKNDSSVMRKEFIPTKDSSLSRQSKCDSQHNIYSVIFLLLTLEKNPNKTNSQYLQVVSQCFTICERSGLRNLWILVIEMHRNVMFIFRWIMTWFDCPKCSFFAVYHSITVHKSSLYVDSNRI